MPSVTTPAAAPGWYGDPAGARVLRWWNGQEWTDDVAARGYEPLPSALLEKEQTAAGRAHLALVGLIVAQVLLALVYVWFVRRIVDEIDAAIDSDGDDPLEFGLEGLAVQPFALAMLGLRVVVYLWVYAAATYSRATGLPARREPSLGVASFFIPIVKYWWPYETIRDALPADHPGSRRALRWWLWYLAFSASLYAAVGTAFIPGAAGYLIAMGILTAIGIPMAIVGQAMITDVVAAHEQLLVERRLDAPVAAGWGASVS